MKVGQEVWLRPSGNAARRNTEPVKTEIAKIGRKYITTKNEIVFSLEDMRQKTEYTANYILFLSKEDLENEIEGERIIRVIRDKFSGYGKVNLSIETLRKIEQLL